jgi:oligopeptidase B
MRLLAACFLLLAAPAAAQTPAPAPRGSMTRPADLPPPPRAEQRPYSFERHGVRVEDPYHWLRDSSYPTVDDEDVLSYLRAENAYFEAAGGSRRTTAPFRSATATGSIGGRSRPARSTAPGIAGPPAAAAISRPSWTRRRRPRASNITEWARSR